MILVEVMILYLIHLIFVISKENYFIILDHWLNLYLLVDSNQF
jgi:hypothetical protein